MITQHNISPSQGKPQHGLVFDIRRYAIHDGPGIRTAVFFKGCPLACRWCHNPEGQASGPELIFRPGRCILCNDCLDACPNNVISRYRDEIRIDRSLCKVSGNCALACPAEALEVVGHEMTIEQVLAEIERDRTFYEQSGGGATFTGGEPLAQPRFLLELLTTCRDRGIPTAVDTSGYAPWSVLDEIRPLVNLFLYDLKLMDETRHIEWTGVSNQVILSNLRQLSELEQEVLVRTPIIPGINDDVENLQAMGKFLAGLATVPPVQLLAYHNIAEAKYAGLGMDYELGGIHPSNREHLDEVAGYLRAFGLQVKF